LGASHHHIPAFPLLLAKKSMTFPGLCVKIFQDLFGARECLNIKKWHLLTIYRVQSTAENSDDDKIHQHSTLHLIKQ